LFVILSKMIAPFDRDCKPSRRAAKLAPLHIAGFLLHGIFPGTAGKIPPFRRQIEVNRR
jgi:hypothetical protein